MRDPDRFEFEADAQLLREGMIGASNNLIKNRNGIKSILITMSLTVLSGLGGMALVTLVAPMLGFSPTWWVLVGWFAAGGLYLASFQLLYTNMAQLLVKKPMNRVPQAIMFNADGVTYEALPAVWKTPWAMVDAIVETKRTVTIVAAGVAFSLPKSVIGDKNAVKVLIGDLNEQISNA